MDRRRGRARRRRRLRPGSHRSPTRSTSSPMGRERARARRRRKRGGVAEGAARRGPDVRARATGVARALDAQGREIGRAAFDFGAQSAVDAHFDLPVELRNESRKVVIDGERSAGATWLVDERSRRRRVAIASGTSADAAQPLIAPNYYLEARARSRSRTSASGMIPRATRSSRCWPKSPPCSRSPT